MIGTIYNRLYRMYFSFLPHNRWRVWPGIKIEISICCERSGLEDVSLMAFHSSAQHSMSTYLHDIDDAYHHREALVVDSTLESVSILFVRQQIIHTSSSCFCFGMI